MNATYSKEIKRCIPIHVFKDVTFLIFMDSFLISLSFVINLYLSVVNWNHNLNKLQAC